MGKRRLGALIGAAVLTFAAVGSVAAVPPPPPSLGISKTADPTELAFGGGSVTYWITVTATTGTYHQVFVTDANCDSAPTWSSGTGSSTAGPSGAGAAGFLHEGDSWTFTCTRDLTGDQPGVYHNTASAEGCTDGSIDGCNQGSHATSGDSNDATVTILEEGQTLPPTAPPTAAPTPTSGGGGVTNVPTQAPTDSTFTGGSGPSDAAWLLVVAFGVLLGSVVVLRPSPTKRRD